MSIGIDFILRANSGAFTRGIATANNSLESLKKNLKHGDLGNGIKGFLGAGVIIQAFRTAMNSAQDARARMEELGKTVDEGTASVARYGDAWDSIFKGVKDGLVTSLSLFTQFGEKIGDKVNELGQSMFGRGFVDSKLAEKIAKDADKAEASLASARKRREERNSPEALAKQQLQIAEAVEKNRLAREQNLTRKIAVLKSQQDKSLAELVRLSNNPDVTKNDRALINAAQLKISEQQAAIQQAEKELADQKKNAKDAQARVDEARTALSNARRDQFLPTVEEAAQFNIPEGTNVVTGDMVAKLRVAEQARNILALESQAMDIGKAGDIAGALALQDRANQLRSGLSGSIISKDANVGADMSKQLDEANKRLEEINASIRDVYVVKGGP